MSKVAPVSLDSDVAVLSTMLSSPLEKESYAFSSATTEECTPESRYEHSSFAAFESVPSMLTSSSVPVDFGSVRILKESL